jgi:hypothetical protein
MKGRVAIDPFAPAYYDNAIIAAVQALERGDATPEQQRMALEWIIIGAAMTYQETFVPGKADLSDYLAGRRNVGLQIVKLLKLKPERKPDGGF